MGNDEDLSRQLKAITVAHELLYDEGARKALAAAPGFLDSLHHRKAAAGAIGGSPAAEGVHLLASEILRQLTLPACPLASCAMQSEQATWFDRMGDFLADIAIA